MVICVEWGADLHMAQLMPLPLTVSCFSKIQIGFTFLVPAHPGSPGKRAAKWVCVCACCVNLVTLVLAVICDSLLVISSGALSAITTGQYRASFAWPTCVSASRWPFATRPTTGSRLTTSWPATSSAPTTELPTVSRSRSICRSASPSAAHSSLPFATTPSTFSARFGTTTTETTTVLSAMHVRCQLASQTLPGCTFCKFCRTLGWVSECVDLYSA